MVIVADAFGLIKPSFGGCFLSSKYLSVGTLKPSGVKIPACVLLAYIEISR